MMHRREERRTATPVNLGSIGMASIAAGPLFLLGLGLGALSTDPATVIPIHADATFLAPAVAILLAASICGIIFAFLPNLIGTIAMTWLSARNEGARLPVLWVLAGAFACALPVFAGGSHGQGPPIMAIALIFTGAGCGLICRRGLAANDRADTADTPHPDKVRRQIARIISGEESNNRR